MGAFLENRLFFAPCSSFVDLLEFRLGYCYFNEGTVKDISDRVRDTFTNGVVNKLIDETSISCWSEACRPAPAQAHGQAQLKADWLCEPSHG